jgi:ketosteroid isomerase-like protein
MTIEDNKALVRRFFEVYTQDGVADAMAFLTEDAVWSFPAKSRMRARFTKPAALENFTHIMNLFDGKMSYVIHSMTAEEDRVSVEFEGIGKLKNGKDYNNLYHFMIVVRDGRISVIKEYFDTLYVIETLPLNIK